MADIGESVPVNDPLPPDERFWKRYSPHHEALLSGVGSLTVHGLVVGFLILLGWAALWAQTSDTARPPNMDVIQLQGDGTGFEGLGGAPGAPGDPGSQENTETVGDQKMPEAPTSKEISNSELDLSRYLKSEISEDLADPQAKTEVGSLLSTLQKEAKTAAVEKSKPRPASSVRTGDAKGMSGRKGQGGLGGAGGGGKGNKFGPAGGGGFGQKLTNQQIYANRWSLYIFEQTPTGKVHAEKLAAAGVILIVVSPRNKAFVVRDLSSRPVKGEELKPADIEELKDRVHWRNPVRESILPLGSELQLPFQPILVAIVLPRDREQEMANVEAEYAHRMGRALNTIQKTVFDFHRRKDGRPGFEPVVLGMQ